jgi:hypothetical protein
MIVVISAAPTMLIWLLLLEPRQLLLHGNSENKPPVRDQNWLTNIAHGLLPFQCQKNS